MKNKPEHKLKVLWSSVSPTISSGYGRVTREIVSRLLKHGFDVINHGYQSRGKPHIIDDTFKMLDSGGDKMYGANVIPKYAKEFEREALITLFDPWVFYDNMPYLDVPWIPYVPVDAEPLDPILTDKLIRAFKVVCFSEFARKELLKSGIKATNIPHGVDTKTFKPHSKQEKKEARKEFHIPEDVFLVGTVGVNLRDRKDFPRMIRIFSEFLKRTKANAYLYIHAYAQAQEGMSYGLNELARLYGIEGRVIFPDQKSVVDFPFSDEGMARMYNVFDVYLSTSRAEGCGLPILEAQACGIPAIVPDNSCQPEWVNGHGWVVPCDDHIVVLTTPQHNKWYLMNIEEAVDAIEDAYGNPNKRKQFGKESRKEMLKYDWDKIIKEKWVPFLDNVWEELHSDVRKVYVGGKTYNIRNFNQDPLMIKENIVEHLYTRHLQLDKNDTWLDIGGHVGTFAIDVADRVKQVYTYEPEKDSHTLLKQNIKENHIKNVSAFNKAVIGNNDKTRTFFTGVNSGAGSLIQTGNKWSGHTREVKCEDINTILKKYNINKIKIDCEGGEYEILKAADLSNIDEIIFEYHFDVLRMAKYEELLVLLSKDFVIRKPSQINPFTDTILHCQRIKPKNV